MLCVLIDALCRGWMGGRLSGEIDGWVDQKGIVAKRTKTECNYERVLTNWFSCDVYL